MPVIIGAHRFEAGRLAMRSFDPDLFLLDDGFQHEDLARDVDLVLWDVCDEPAKMRQLPAGRLREGLGALNRASALILTHSEVLPASGRAEHVARVGAELKRYAPGAPLFEAISELRGFRAVGPDESVRSPLEPMEQLRGRRVLLLSGLARPEGFEAMVRLAGVDVAGHLSYPDHIAYGQGRLDAAQQARKRTAADLVLTTEKDAVKLESLGVGDHGIYSVSLGMRVADAERWTGFLSGLLARHLIQT
jgi:tetraacyldisaccharide 4'-kinase